MDFRVCFPEIEKGEGISRFRLDRLNDPASQGQDALDRKQEGKGRQDERGADCIQNNGDDIRARGFTRSGQ